MRQTYYMPAPQNCYKSAFGGKKKVVSTDLIVIIKAYIWEIRDVRRGRRGILPG